MTNDRHALERVEAERLVRAGLTYDEIASKLGVSSKTVRNWKNRNGWSRGPSHPLGPLAAAAQSPPAGQQKKRSTSKPLPVDRAELIRRLYAAIESNLQHLEQRMNDDTTPTAADGERDARALGTAIRNIEKVTELETGTERDANAPRENGHGFTSADADRLRLELAERILRLCRNRSKD